jgi:hypothetical protein
VTFDRLAQQARRLLLSFLLRAAQPEEQSMDIEKDVEEAGTAIGGAVIGVAKSLLGDAESAASGVKADVEKIGAAAAAFVEDSASAILRDLGHIHNRIDRSVPVTTDCVLRARNALEQAIVELAKHIGG